jgi:UPF0271 protein
MILDLNSDLGEGCGQDREILPYITSANVACGAYAGDAPTIRDTLRQAKAHGVRIGAHPGFFDRDHFGRKELTRDPADVFTDCVYQIGALQALARCEGLTVSYIKPHGALYNMAQRDDSLAQALAEVAAQFGLPLMGLPGSRLQMRSRGLVPYIAEGFADRRYRPDGSLVPRGEPASIIENVAEAVAQALDLVRRGVIQSLCVHGDHPQAVTFVKELRSSLIAAGVEIRSAL